MNNHLRTAPQPAVLPQPRELVAALPVYSKAGGSIPPMWRASSNESFLPPSSAVLAAIAEAASHCQRYPTLTGEHLIDALSLRLGVAPEQLVTGGGSLAVLQQLLTAFAGPGTEVVFAWRSYEAYPILVRLTGASCVEVPLTAEHCHDLSTMASAVTDTTAAVILCSPNNPTGTVIGSSELKDMLAAIPSQVVVVLDQAYLEFTDDADASSQHSLDLLATHPNLVILQTFSKAYGLAGLRAGYMVAHPELAAHVRAASPPFGLNAIAEAASVAALANRQAMERNVATVREGRIALSTEFTARGLVFPDSGSNFLWLPVAEEAEALEAACLAHSVGVRCFPGEGVRITVGSRDAEAAVLRAVDAWLVNRSH
ncbi:histidinol-phosphate transaminase [Arthrobacter antibioticus]|uniref:histidinol-phosphate transaminase n=1 Tax=Arthrobacter sp. H35-MC1 TaxID=3046203 RepID=UPI0024BB39BF|nr:histidinol-phosphate transaminase [Arthrobacter sp. H35-MC1]MDJ0316220.1 histidinol-phosphate transaminase [Arthrobacter sp. H35-MC1]